jgi:hypothetical protein
MFARLMQWRDQIDLSLCLPSSAWPLSRKAKVFHIGVVKPVKSFLFRHAKR